MSRNASNHHRMARLIGIGALLLCGGSGAVAAQSLDAVQFASGWQNPTEQNIPPDVRIMRTIVSTALSQVKAPEMPKELTAEGRGSGTDTLSADSLRFGVDPEVAYVFSGRASSFINRGDVSGFYMKGYGYLFTVSWPVSSMAAYTAQLADRIRAGRPTTQSPRQRMSSQWAAEYRQRLSDALRDVIAGYGSTLRRAAPGEAITFIADFGGGDSDQVTMSVKVDALHGTNASVNRAAIKVSTGQNGVPDEMHTQLEIMSHIIDTSLRPEDENRGFYVGDLGSYYGGTAEAQYVVGYGVIFRKNARLNTARTFVTMPSRTLREATVDSVQAHADKSYRAHLDTLRIKTAAILATYGSTITELKDDDWVGIYYNVGSAATLLNGLDDYLVQARMRDVRQAANQGDPASWLAGRLVTNEKPE